MLTMHSPSPSGVLCAAPTNTSDHAIPPSVLRCGPAHSRFLFLHQTRDSGTARSGGNSAGNNTRRARRENQTRTGKARGTGGGEDR